MGGKLPLKETRVGQTAHMMIFADGAGDMGNLQKQENEYRLTILSAVGHR